MARFHRGDELLFRQLVDRYTPRLLAFARPFASDLDATHDLVQETWHRVFEKRRSFRGDGTLLGWLFAICRNVGLGETRRRSARPRAVVVPDVVVPAPGPGPDLDAERAELRRSIARAIMDLPSRERDVVILRLVDRSSTRETAQAMGCAEGTVKAALHHAVRKLRDAMEVWVK